MIKNLASIFFSLEQFLNEINLIPKKSSQTTNMTFPIIKNKDIALFLYSFNNSLSSSFPSCLKYEDVRPPLKRLSKLKKKILDHEHSPTCK